MYLSLLVMRFKRINIVDRVAGWLLFFSLVMGFVSKSPGDQDVMQPDLSIINYKEIVSENLFISSQT
jgi:hypothetical protein